MKKRPYFCLYGIVVFIVFSISCNKVNIEERLPVEENKEFNNIQFIKKFSITNLYTRWCVAFPGGVLCDEVMDVNGKEIKLNYYDYAGKLLKTRIINSGDGPNEFKIVGYDSIWTSPKGQIFCIDNEYFLKTIDTHDLSIKPIARIIDFINGYGSKYIFSRDSGTSFEMKENVIATTFESTAFFENLTYYSVIFDDKFGNFKEISTQKKGKLSPVFDIKEEGKGKPFSSHIDYYNHLRKARLFTVDWKGERIFFVPDIEKPEIESVNMKGTQKGKYHIELDYKENKINENELNLYHKYILDNSSSIIKSHFEQKMYFPPNAPAILSLKIFKDWLIVITGKRDWERGENEALIYQLPDLHYEGHFFMPFTNCIGAKWFGDHYIVKTLLLGGDEPSFRYDIYEVLCK